MDSTSLAPATENAVKNYLASPAPVLILHGPPGSGKVAAARQILANILPVVKDKLMSYPYIRVIEPEKDSISIDQIRSMQAYLVRSVPGDQPIRRAVLIVAAQKLTDEAQNALLKSLEEPPVDTVFVLCVDNLNNLLSTVVSRSRQLAVVPLTEYEAKNSFGDKPDVVKAYHMSEGRAGLLRALLDDGEHPMLQAVENAKDILNKTPYERLLLVNSLSKDKPAVEELLQALQLLARISMTSSVKNDKTSQAKRWHTINRQVISAQQSIKHNAGLKLVLTDLFLQL